MLINVLRGEMSIVGPRPTEPERVDPGDPAWVTISAARPGLFNLAGLLLATRFNRTSQYDRNTLEMEYLLRRTPWSDVRLLADGLVGLVRSRGNWKARGQPSIDAAPARH